MRSDFDTRKIDRGNLDRDHSLLQECLVEECGRGKFDTSTIKFD